MASSVLGWENQQLNKISSKLEQDGGDVAQYEPWVQYPVLQIDRWINKIDKV